MLRWSLRRFATAASSSPKPFDAMPGPPAWPLVGSVPSLMRKLDHKKGGVGGVIKEWYKEYGPVFRMQLIGGEQSVYVAHPQDVREVYLAEGKYPFGALGSNWPFAEFEKLHPSSGTSAGLLKVGPEWRESRTTLNKHLFLSTDANEYIPLLQKEIRKISEIMGRQNTFEIHHFMRLVVFDLFCSGMAGHSWNACDKEKSTQLALDFVNVTAKSFELMGPLIFSPLGPRFAKRLPAWKQFIDARLEQKRLSRLLVEQVNKESGESYISKQLRDGVSIEDASEVLANLLGAAVDTTSVALSHFLYALAAHPDVQTKIAQELKQVLKGGDYSEDVKLPYLKAAWRESQRAYPVGIVTSLRRTLEDMVLSGYTVPKGTAVNFITNTFENDPTLIEDADKYRPERWLEAEVAARKGTPKEILDHKLLGFHGMFSFGPRMCLGARFAVNEVMVAASRLIQDYEFSVVKAPDGVQQRLLLFMDPDPVLKVVRRN